MNNNELVATFEERLAYAMSLRGKRQIDLANHFGWSRSTVSQYCDPKISYKPKADRMYRIAEYLNVSPVWLMGYDVPMNGVSERDRLVEIVNDMDSRSVSALVAYAEGLRAAFKDYESKK